MREISKEELFSFGASASAVIVFNNPNCTNCPDMNSFFREKIEPSINSKSLNIYSIDVDDDIINAFKLSEAPVVSIFKNGVEYYSSLGLYENENNKRDIEDFLFYVNSLFREN